VKARTGFHSRAADGMWNLAEVLKGDGRIPLPPLPLLTKEGSEKPRKLPTHFGEEPFFLTIGFRIVGFSFVRGLSHPTQTLIDCSLAAIKLLHFALLQIF